VEAGRFQDLEPVIAEERAGLVVTELAEMVGAVGSLRPIDDVGEPAPVRGGEDEGAARAQDAPELVHSRGRIRQMLDQLPREEPVEGGGAKGQRMRIPHHPAQGGELRLARGEEVEVHVRGHDPEPPVRTDLGEQAAPAPGVQDARSGREVPEEQPLELAQHRGVQLVQEGLRRRVTVLGVDAMVVGAQHLGIGHASGHEPVLQDATVPAQHELDAHDGIEGVVGVGPGVGRRDAARRRLHPERARPDLGEVDADRALRRPFRQREDPVADVGVRVLLAQVRVQIHGEDVARAVLHRAAEADLTPAAGEVDDGREGNDARHEGRVGP
jgi:hypothetical protein